MVNITKIESLIKEKGWSNSHFCALLDKNKGWIRDWKRGVGIPNENTLKSIADTLDTTVDYLTDKTEQKNKPVTDRDRLSEEDKKIIELLHMVPAEDRKMLVGMIEGALKSRGLLR
jgi:transcriptional regulator with XRE-family HTH domain